MARQHSCELRIALGGKHRNGVTDRPERNAGDPELKADTKRGGDGPVQDRHRAWRPAEQDRLGKSAM